MRLGLGKRVRRIIKCTVNKGELKMEQIEITEIKVTAKAGASIGRCLQESLKLATTEWRNVRLFFNGKQYLIQPNELLAACKEDLS
jgi:hypothetical protein